MDAQVDKVAVIHGLNLDPRRMGPLEQMIAGAGFEPASLVLSGHGAGHTIETLKGVSAELWLSECAALQRDKECVGALVYSLGALVWLVHLLETDACAAAELPRFQVLFAPAIGLRWYTRAIQALQPFGSLVIPSLSHPAYRRHTGLPIPAYRALFQLIRRLRDWAVQGRRLQVPTLVVLNKKDELIDPCLTLSLLSEILSEPPRSVFVRSSASRLTPSYAHLMLDNESLGEDEYERLMKEVTGFVGMFR